jgi:diguanylate cyclase (GGDEF)-like protein
MAVTPPAGLRNRSLGRRLVLATVGFCIVFTLLTAAVRTWSAWQQQLGTMTAELTLIDQVFQRTLAKSIWEMDREALQTHVQSAAQSAAVGRISLQIRQANGKSELLEHRQVGWEPSARVPSVQRVLTYEPYAGASETIGTLTLESDERVLWRRLAGEVTHIVITQVVQAVLLAGLVMWMFNRTVTVHVRHIARHLSTLTPQSLKQALHLERAPARSDELSLLETGVNQLQASLSVYIERQHRDERELAAHRDRLADLVKERTTELQSANARLQDLSLRDPLTGLANRRRFDEVKEDEFRRALRQKHGLAVLVCDVDHFKRYNDTYGHVMGDQCLRAIAQALQQCFGRAGELVARIGGEEFAVLLPGLDQAGALAAGERLRRAVAAQAIPHAGSDNAAHVTLSVGVAALGEQRVETFDALFDHADQALYRAKSQGRNRVAA